MSEIKDNKQPGLASPAAEINASKPAIKPGEVKPVTKTPEVKTAEKTADKTVEVKPEVKKREPILTDFILVVEDSKPNADILQLHFKAQKFSVFVCDDGQEAKIFLDSLNSEERKKMRAIFSDIMMPNMSGIELLTYIRSVPELTKIPFVFVSAVSDTSLVKEAAALKPNGFLLKPITREKIIAKLSALLSV